MPTVSISIENSAGHIHYEPKRRPAIQHLAIFLSHKRKGVVHQLRKGLWWDGRVEVSFVPYELFLIFIQNILLGEKGDIKIAKIVLHN